MSWEILLKKDGVSLEELKEAWNNLKSKFDTYHYKDDRRVAVSGVHGNLAIYNFIDLLKKIEILDDGDFDSDMEDD